MSNHNRLVSFRLTDQEFQTLQEVMSEEGFQHLSKYIRHKCLYSITRKSPAKIRFESDVSLIRNHFLKFFSLPEVKTKESKQKFETSISERINKILSDYNREID